MTEHNKTFIFIPLYNVSIEDDVIDTDISGYKIITSEQYFNDYRLLINNENSLLNTQDLDEAVKIPQPGMLATNPLSRYILIAQVPAKYNDEENNKTISNMLLWATWFITACRLYKSGNIQVDSYYVLSKVEYRRGSLSIATHLKDIESWFAYRKTKSLFLEEYGIKKSDISFILQLSDKVVKTKDFNLPISYFMDYYTTRNLYEKILKLSIILETTLLQGKDTDLGYALQMRGSAFLQQDFSQLLKLAYDVRSKIIHTGNITSNLAKRLKSFLSEEERENDLDYVFIFIKEHLEPFVRKVLMRFLDEMHTNHTNLKTTAENIDKLILNKLIK